MTGHKTRTCNKCSEEFKPSSNHLTCPKCRAKARPKTACVDCGTLNQYDLKRCKECSTKGCNNGQWKGGKTYHKKGYVMVRVSDHPRAKNNRYVFEHILIMEKILGRYLLPGETVHHKNNVKADNREINLELWSGSQPTGARVSDLVEWARELLETYG